MYQILKNSGLPAPDHQRVMQVYNEGRLHMREDGSTYFVGQPVMIRFKKLSELDASLSTTNPNETSMSASSSSKNGSSIVSYEQFLQN